jgi:two-component system, NarL family, response regulator NreC
VLRIVIVDDHTEIRDALRRIVDAQGDMEVVAEASNGQVALGCVQALLPSVVLMDVSMPGWSGVTTTEKVRGACPEVKVIAISRHDDPAIVRAMLEAGAAGYLLKQRASTELIDAIRAVAAGATHVDSSMLAANGPRVQAACGESHAPDLAAPLTEMEERVLQLVASAYSNHQIGCALSISADAAAALKTQAMRRAGLVSRIQVIGYARQRGWMPQS